LLVLLGEGLRLRALGEAAGEAGLPLEVILFRVVPAEEGHTQRLGHRGGINTGRVRLVVQRVGRRIPELDVIAELPLLLLGQARNGHLDLDLGGVFHAGPGFPGVSARNGGGFVGISESLRISDLATSRSGGLRDVLALKEIVLVDGRLAIQAIRP
jgi:hypothetical protein